MWCRYLRPMNTDGGPAMVMTTDTPMTCTGTIWCCFTSTSIPRRDGGVVQGECEILPILLSDIAALER